MSPGLATCLLTILLMGATAPAHAQQQIVDPDFDPRVIEPAYRADGPRVTIDAAHNNFHTADGQYAPFAALMRADGFRVTSGASGFSAASLAATDILVISNARGKPAPASAFTAAEADAVRDWVAGGGSLLLIADHTPFGSAAADFAGRFGVTMGKGYAFINPPKGRLTTQIEYRGDALGNHPIIAGRNDKERIRSVKTFTGQSLSGPPRAAILLRLPEAAREVPDTDALDAAASGKPATVTPVGGRAQALAFTHGKGRVVVLGEAGMLSAQLIRLPGRPEMRVGMSVKGYDDRQFALNVMHWLSGLLTAPTGTFTHATMGGVVPW